MSAECGAADAHELHHILHLVRSARINTTAAATDRVLACIPPFRTATMYKSGRCLGPADIYADTSPRRGAVQPLWPGASVGAVCSEMHYPLPNWRTKALACLASAFLCIRVFYVYTMHECGHTKFIWADMQNEVVWDRQVICMTQPSLPCMSGCVRRRRKQPRRGRVAA